MVFALVRGLSVKDGPARATPWQRTRRASLPELFAACESTSLSYPPCHLASRQGLPEAAPAGDLGNERGIRPAAGLQSNASKEVLDEPNCREDWAGGPRPAD